MDNGGYDDETDETLAERFLGLQEMFPIPVRQAVGTAANGIFNNAKKFASNPSLMFAAVSFILWARLIQKINRLN
ncbi:mitochondrial import receptor subunit TOM22 homolog [Drosophila pseudoobscura]|uniref:Mitochondrial import receptor subunit TOM22 homolog n=1 Tax=Drosophila pseudoobscura pseudoobscura TaxID=46245 RepID=B5DM71_DROPS|nr:mitochondrial import receptor subunit TOM22 homolog [Drosophila pseudoobscura]